MDQFPLQDRQRDPNPILEKPVQNRKRPCRGQILVGRILRRQTMYHLPLQNRRVYRVKKSKTPAIADRGCSPFGVEPAAPCGWDSIAAAGRVDSTELPLASG